MNVIGISGLDNSVAFKQRELPDLDRREYRIAQGFDSAAALVIVQCAVRIDRPEAVGQHYSGSS